MLVEKSSSGPGAGERFAINTKELEIQNLYYIVNMLENKLENNNLPLAELKKISDDIKKIEMSIPKKEKELYEIKKDLEKKLEPIKQDLLKIKMNKEQIKILRDIF